MLKEKSLSRKIVDTIIATLWICVIIYPDIRLYIFAMLFFVIGVVNFSNVIYLKRKICIVATAVDIIIFLGIILTVV